MKFMRLVAIVVSPLARARLTKNYDGTANVEAYIRRLREFLLPKLEPAPASPRHRRQDGE